MKALFILFYLYLMALPLIGIVQLTGSLLRYFSKNKPLSYYKKLEKYFKVVLGYALFAIAYLGCCQLMPELPNSNFGFILSIGYFTIIPGLIAVYYLRIITNDYPEEIEKLIF